jgi:hypothetical protein
MRIIAPKKSYHRSRGFMRRIWDFSSAAQAALA